MSVIERCPDVIIAGGGPAGMALALSLLEHAWGPGGTGWPEGVRVRVLERDASPEAREDVGYTLSLRSDPRSGGVQAIDQLGLFSLAASHATHSEGFRMADARGERVIDIRGPEVRSKRTGNIIHSLRIRRGVLRKIMHEELLRRVAEHSNNNNNHSSNAKGCITVEWNAGVAAASEFVDGEGKRRVRATLMDGRVMECSLLVAADGGRSKVRSSFRPELQPKYNGVVGYGGSVSYPSGLPSPLSTHHMVSSDGQGQSVFMAATDKSTAIFFLSQKVERESTARDMEALPPQAKLDAAKALSSGFSPEHALRDMLSRVKKEDMNAMLCTDMPTPVRHVPSWLPAPPPPPAGKDADVRTARVMFLGDAAHCVSPFAGNGANMAIMDGFVLGGLLLNKQLCPAGGSDDDAVAALMAAYDADSRPRTQRAVDDSYVSIKMAHGQGWSHHLMFAALGGLGWVIAHWRAVKFGLGVVAVAAAAAGGAALWRRR